MSLELQVMDYVKKALKGMEPHGFEHTMRVYKLTMKLAQAYQGKVDLEVLKLAALLHDIGRPLEETVKEHHAIISSRIAREVLREYGARDEIIERIVEAIISHSYSLKIRPRTLEAMILSDADKLDAMGAIGIARCFMESGKRGRSLEESLKHFYEKLLRLKDMMYTEEAKSLAEKRHKFMVEFLKQLREEIEALS
ncbi:MAG: phosphohydrolase [Thermoprotei archaeon]|nr:MAG: phosphohydrolase [Thermoprotei archaeon]RLF24112.1 MAG: phosphohydrolase [Thermoprotei archaeon]